MTKLSVAGSLTTPPWFGTPRIKPLKNEIATVNFILKKSVVSQSGDEATIQLQINKLQLQITKLNSIQLKPFFYYFTNYLNQKF